MPANQSQNIIEATSPTALALMSPDGMNPGTLARVGGAYNRWYRLTADSPAATADGLTVLNVNTGVPGGAVSNSPTLRWVLSNLGDSFYGSSPNQSLVWCVDPINGSDANDGKTIGTALKTLAELSIRWFNCAAPVTGTVIVYLLNAGAVANGDNTLVIKRALWTTENNVAQSSLLFIGSESTFLTGTLSAVQNMDKTTQKMQWVESTTLAASWTASNAVGTKIILTSGPNAGAFAWIVEDLAGANKRAKTTPFFIQTNTGGSVDPYGSNPTWTKVTLVGTETFKLVTQPEIPKGLYINTDANAIITFQNIRLSGQGAVNFNEIANVGLVNFYGCTTSNAAESDIGLIRNYSDGNLTFAYSRCHLTSAVTTSLCAGSGNVSYSDSWIGGRVFLGFGGGYEYIGGAAGSVLDKRNSLATRNNANMSIGPLCIAGNAQSGVIVPGIDATVTVSDYIFGDSGQIATGAAFNMRNAWAGVFYSNIAHVNGLATGTIVTSFADFGGAAGVKTAAQIPFNSTATAAESQASFMASTR
jgi:hypothetical protein